MEKSDDLKDRPGFVLFTEEETLFLLGIIGAICLLLDILKVWA